MSSLPSLNLLQTRILGVLVEKQHTVPDTYPLSLNALQSGCNQKTSRDPVIEANETQLLEALDSLLDLGLVTETNTTRVKRYGQSIAPVLRVPSQSIALLATLMLRGAQTAAQLRTNSERLHHFADISSVEAFLEELAARADGALVKMLPKAPGSRENRWIHLLSPAPESSGQSASTAHEDELRQEVLELREQIRELREQLHYLYAQLDLTAPTGDDHV